MNKRTWTLLGKKKISHTKTPTIPGTNKPLKETKQQQQQQKPKQLNIKFLFLPWITISLFFYSFLFLLHSFFPMFLTSVCNIRAITLHWDVFEKKPDPISFYLPWILPALPPFFLAPLLHDLPSFIFLTSNGIFICALASSNLNNNLNNLTTTT